MSRCKGSLGTTKIRKDEGMLKVNKSNHTITGRHCIKTCAREHYEQKASNCTEGKDKSNLCLIKHRTVKANGIEVELHAFLIPKLDGCERLIYIHK
jgi:hypothetical protein